MKKLFVIAFVLVSVQSYSQGLMKRLSFGLKAGGNYSDFTNTTFKTEGLAGFHAGLTVNFKLSDQFSIQEEFLYTTQGAEMKDKTFGVDDLTLSYVAVPIMLRYKTPIGIFIEAGPQVNAYVDDNVDHTQYKNFAKKIDYGVSGGLGYQSPMGLGISVRYTAGLADVGDYSSSAIKKDFRNNVAQASIFYVF